MNNTVRKSLIILLFLSFLSCVDVIDIEGPAVERRLVVEGWITNDLDLSYVQLTYTVPFSNTFPYTAANPLISNADVRIISEDLKSIINFREMKPGYYKALDVGVVGESYILELIIEGKVYKTKPQEMIAGPSIDKLSYDFNQKITIRENAAGSFYEHKEYVFDVYAYTEDPADESNYYYWKADGIGEFLSMPIGDTPCDECICYLNDNRLNQTIRLENDEIYNGMAFRKRVATIPINRLTKYLTQVYQYSLTAPAFEYWQKIYEQHENVGSIFDPAPSQIPGNIYLVSEHDNHDDEKEIVYGFFFTSTVSKMDMLIDRALEAGKLGIVPQNLIPIIEGDCRQQYPGAYSEPVPPQFQYQTF